MKRLLLLVFLAPYLCWCSEENIWADGKKRKHLRTATTSTSEKLITKETKAIRSIESTPSLSTVSSLTQCPVSAFFGQVYLAPITISQRGTFCFRLNLLIGGIFDADIDSPDCTTATFTNTAQIGKIAFESNERAFVFDSNGPFGDDGMIVIREDPGASNVVMNVGTPFYGKENFVINLLLPSCTSDSTVSPSEMSSQQPSGAPIYTQSPSEISSHKPSAAPIYTQMPSEAPSQLLTVYPSCSTEDFLGRTYIASTIFKGKSVCLKIELFEEGALFVERNSDCSKEVFVEDMKLSLYQPNFSFSNKARFVGLYDGFVSFKEAPNVSEVLAQVPKIDTQARSFEITLIVPSCTAPSLSPSSVPSTTVSSNPSSTPSTTPSYASSTSPTTEYSTAPSSTPTVNLSCSADEFLGGTYFVSTTFRGKSVCLKIELFQGGSLFAERNSDCSKGVFVEEIELSSYQSSSSSIALFVGLYDGFVSFKEVPDAGEVLAEEPKIDENFQTFEITFIVPSCFVPSLSPSSVPSTTASSNPSSTPSTAPSVSPTACVDEPGWVTVSEIFPNKTCENIEESPDFFCEYFGRSNGKTPNEACCICGGGKHISPAPSFEDSQSPSTAPSASAHPSAAPSELPSAVCTDEPNWIWDERLNYSCEQLTESFCSEELIVNGMNSYQACCVCGEREKGI